MPARTIRKRARYFLAVEGESEQSFIAWIQMLSQDTLHIHLDAFVLDGGGFKSMLRKAVEEHKPANASALRRQYSLDDLIRVANLDADLAAFLKSIGLMNARGCPISTDIAR